VSDIQTLNEWATEGRLEVTAISLGAYSAVADRYVLLPHGASIGSGYGPVVVTREPADLERLRGLEIVIPGRLTTAYLVLRLALGDDVRVRELPFDRILGEWWLLETGLPLPLGVNVARRDLGELLPAVSDVLGAAIRTGLEHRGEAMEYARRFGRGIDEATTDRFVAMYVNDMTCDYGDEGREAVAELLRRAGSGTIAEFAA
jgi:1,4-dihydroxy-6-naphthoate synthase